MNTEAERAASFYPPPKPFLIHKQGGRCKLFFGATYMCLSEVCMKEFCQLESAASVLELIS